MNVTSLYASAHASLLRITASWICISSEPKVAAAPESYGTENKKKKKKTPMIKHWNFHILQKDVIVGFFKWFM